MALMEFFFLFSIMIGKCSGLAENVLDFCRPDEKESQSVVCLDEVFIEGKNFCLALLFYFKLVMFSFIMSILVICFGL